MDLQTFTYQEGNGWSVSPLPQLDSERTLVIAFGAPEFRDAPGPIAELASAYPRSHLIGCSTAGEIFGTSLADRSLSVAVLRFTSTEIATAHAPVETAADSRQAGEHLARQLTRPDLRGVLVLSDGHNVNGSQLIRGLNTVLPPATVVTGGLAGDGDRFQRTWIVRDGAPREGCVSAVGLYGDRVRIGHGSKGGWDIFGPERRVTRSVGNTLYELDGQPALGLYKSYLGDRAADLPASGLLFPLAVRAHREDEKRIVRTILAVDEEEHALVFAGDVPEGSLAQLMRANFDRLIGGASEAAEMLGSGSANGGPSLCIAISCVGRRLVLGERTEEELEATLDVLPPGTHQIGFYSYGEISPFGTGHCDLHNQTMTLTTIGEA